MMNKLKVVLDTNVLLASVLSKSKYHWLYQSLLERKFDLFMTNEDIKDHPSPYNNNRLVEIDQYNASFFGFSFEKNNYQKK